MCNRRRCPENLAQARSKDRSAIPATRGHNSWRLADDDRTLKDLKSELAAEADEIKRLKSPGDAAAATRTRNDERSGVNVGADSSSRRAAELAAAQANLQALQIKADALSQQREDAARRSLSK